MDLNFSVRECTYENAQQLGKQLLKGRLQLLPKTVACNLLTT
jgi:hypothetical protein